MSEPAARPRFPIFIPHASRPECAGTVEGTAAFEAFLDQFAGRYRAAPHTFFASKRSVDYGSGEEATAKALERIFDQAEAAGAAPIFFGGDHTISYWPVGLAAQRYRRLSLVVFDAHSDVQGDERALRNWNVIRRIMEDWGASVDLVHVGFRDMDEAALAKFAYRVIPACDFIDAPAAIRALLDAVSGRPIYLSIDLDVLDPTAFRAVSAPISGGLSVLQVFAAIKALRGQNVVAADIVEYDHRRRAGDEMLVLADLFYQTAGLCAREDRLLRR